MSFTDQKPFRVAQEHVVGFTRHRKPWCCSLCGHVFAAGDIARWVYANSTPGLGCGNFFVCPKCDGENGEVLERAKANFQQAIAASKRWGISES